mgnify:CR=1 FL=1
MAIEGGSIAETQERLESILLKEGNRFMSQRNEVIELLNVHSVIRMPYIRGHNDKWKGLMLDNYIDQWFKRNDQGFVYTYGDRILAYPTFEQKINHHNHAKVIKGYIDQMQFVINELKENPNSRRAMIIIYSPAIDNGREDVPCLQTLQFQLRNKVLLTTVQYRSHDIDAYYPNLCGIAEVAKYIASQIGLMVTMGEINVYSNNLHKYISEL